MRNPPYPVVLASASPRRADLLRKLVPEFAVVAPCVEEVLPEIGDPWQIAQSFARDKALEVFERRPDALVIGGDTVVALSAGDGFELLGKPSGADEAAKMLRRLSGREHVVVSGLALRWPHGMIACTDSATLQFRAINDDEIADYVAGGEPLDKAGAYAIQGTARAFVQRLKGSVDTVVGLPVDRLREALSEVR